MIYKDLNDALDDLALELPIDNLIDEDWIIVAVSEAGIYLAKKIAQMSGSDFEILFSETILAPNNYDCKIAIVSESEEIIIHHELIESFGISLDFVYGEAHRQYEDKILQYKNKYRQGLNMKSLKNRKVLFVAEGVDTGLTMMVALKSAIVEGASTVSIATPIISSELYDSLNEITDDIFTANKISEFINIDYYYEDVSKLKYSYIKSKIEE